MKVQEAAKARLNLDVSRETYFEDGNELIAEGQLGKGVGYGGSVYRLKETTIEEEPKMAQKQRSNLSKILFDAHSERWHEAYSNGAASSEKVQEDRTRRSLKPGRIKGDILQ